MTTTGKKLTGVTAGAVKRPSDAAEGNDFELFKHLLPEDRQRAEDYSHDLLQGLNAIRSYTQGVGIFGSARTPETDKYYKLARKLGQGLAEHGHTVITGGGPGIMEAANRGAFEYGGRSVGLNIMLAHEQQANPYLTDMVLFEYFFARKVTLAMSSKVFVFFPGGFGTLDEFSEVLILMQEKRMPRMPLYLVGKSYWRPLDKFFRTKFVDSKMIHKRDTAIYRITDDVSEIVKAADHVGHPKLNVNYYDGFSAQNLIHPN